MTKRKISEIKFPIVDGRPSVEGIGIVHHGYMGESKAEKQIQELREYIAKLQKQIRELSELKELIAKLKTVVLEEKH